MPHTFLRQSYTTPLTMRFGGPAGHLSGPGRRVGDVYPQGEGRAVGGVYQQDQGKAVGGVYQQDQGKAVGGVYQQDQGKAVGDVYPQGEGRAIHGARIGAVHMVPGSRRWGTPPNQYPPTRRVAQQRQVPRTLRGPSLGQDSPNPELEKEALSLFDELPAQPRDRKDAFRKRVSDCRGIPANPSVADFSEADIKTVQADCLKDVIADLKEALGKRGKPETLILIGAAAALGLAILFS